MALPGKKFLFDLNDFDDEAIRAREAAARRPTFSQEQVEAARQAGYDAGRVEGMKEAIGSQEAQIRDLVQQIVIAADRMSQDEADRMATFIDQAALIAVQALSRTLPALMATLAVDQIVHFITGVLEDQVKGQAIGIHVAPSREAAVRERLETTRETMGRRTAWTIAADPALHELQCRIEWTGGGAEWDPQTVADTLLATIVTHLPEHLRGDAILPPAEPETATAAAPPAAKPAPRAKGRKAAAVDETPQTPHTDSNSGDAS